MEKVKNFVILVSLIHITVQNPLTADFLPRMKNDRIENKNWKLKAGFYEDNHEYSNSFNDSPTTYRLPNNTLPVRYDIFITTYVHKGEFKFNGIVEIKIRAIEKTNTVTLHYRDLNVTKVSLYNLIGQVVEDNLNFEYVDPKEFEFLKITLPREIDADEYFVLFLMYDGELNTKQTGFYRAYFTEDSKTFNFAVTQFEATDARHAFPCYDEPGIRTPFGINLIHDKSYTAWSNMEIEQIIPIDGTDYVISKFLDTPSMQTYLVAFLVAPFDYISNNDTETLQRIIAKPSSIRNGEAEFALQLVGPVLRKLENFLDLKFTLPKLDHAAITQFLVGAMENWGLVTYRESGLLFEPTGHFETDFSRKRRIITVMAHEDAHQYFGNLVSPHW